MLIYFTKHARNKFAILQNHNIFITEEQVRNTVTNPERIDHSRLPLLIAQTHIDSEHVLRVVYNIEHGRIKIITFYPGRTTQYEIQQQ